MPRLISDHTGGERLHVLEPELSLTARPHALYPVRGPCEEGLGVESWMMRVVCQKYFIGFRIFGNNKVAVVIFVNANSLTQCPLKCTPQWAPRFSRSLILVNKLKIVTTINLVELDIGGGSGRWPGKGSQQPKQGEWECSDTCDPFDVPRVPLQDSHYWRYINIVCTRGESIRTLVESTADRVTKTFTTPFLSASRFSLFS